MLGVVISFYGNELGWSGLKIDALAFLWKTAERLLLRFMISSLWASVLWVSIRELKLSSSKNWVESSDAVPTFCLVGVG